MQTKLTVNVPGDEYEQEADRVAEQVMRMPESSPDTGTGIASAVPGVQRKCSCGGSCDECQAEQGHKHEQLQLKSVGGSDFGQAQAPSIVHEVLRSPGQPLDAATRTFMEPRFGRDFSHVQLHTGSIAAHSAGEMQARAYTVEHDIVFAPNQFSPATSEGRRLLAHELAHVVQQSGGTASIQRAPDPTEAAAAKQFDERIKRINHLLSYSWKDWAITDSEAIAAFQLLKLMTSPERSRAFEQIRLDRLIDNLPDRFLPELRRMIVQSGSERTVLTLVQKIPAEQALSLLEVLPNEQRDRTLENIPRNERKRLHDALPKWGRKRFLELWDQKEQRNMDRELQALRPLQRGERFLLRVALKASNELVEASMPQGVPVKIDEDGEVYYRPLDIAVSIAGRTRSEAEGTLAENLSQAAGSALKVDLQNPPAVSDESSFETKPKKVVTDAAKESAKQKPAPDPMFDRQQEYRYFIVHIGKTIQEQYQLLQKSPTDDRLSKDFLEESDAFHTFVDWFDKNENSPKLLKLDPGTVYGQIRAKVTIAAIKKDVKKKYELEQEAKRNSPEALQARAKKWDEIFNLAMWLKAESSRRFPYSIPLDSEGADILVTGDPVRQAVLDRIADELMGWSREHFLDDNYASVNPKYILAYILKSGYGALLGEADKYPLEHERIDRHELIADTVFGAFASAVITGLTAVALVGAVVGLGIVSGGTALVVLGGMAAYSGVTSYMARRKEIEEKGYEVSVSETVLDSIGDVVGLSQAVEGITGERLGTHEQLTSVQRSEQLGGGLGGIAVLLVGSRAYKFGQGVGQTLRLSGPGSVPPTLEGVPREALESKFKKTTEPVKPTQYPTPGKLEAAARAALPERIQVGFDRWMESMRSNPRKPVNVENTLSKMTPEQIERISSGPAEDYYRQLAEGERVQEAKGRSMGDPLRPKLRHTEWKDGVTIHYEKTAPDPVEIRHGQEIQARTGETVHIFGDTPSNQTFPGIDGTIGEPPRPLQLKDVHGPEWLKVDAHDAFQNASKFGYSKVEVHLRIPDSTVAECKAAWEGKPGHARGEKVGWETDFSTKKNTLPLAKLVIEAKDGVWEVSAPLTSPNLPGVPVPSPRDEEKKPAGVNR